MYLLMKTKTGHVTLTMPPLAIICEQAGSYRGFNRCTKFEEHNFTRSKSRKNNRKYTKIGDCGG